MSKAALRALASDRRLLILEWLKQPKAHFRAQVDGDLVTRRRLRRADRRETRRQPADRQRASEDPVAGRIAELQADQAMDVLQARRSPHCEAETGHRGQDYGIDGDTALSSDLAWILPDFPDRARLAFALPTLKLRHSRNSRPFPDRSTHEAPSTEKLPPHRGQGRLVAADRFRRGRGQGVVARGAGRRHRQTARRRPRRADRLVGLDRARPQPPEAAARRAEAGREPGRRRGRPDRAGADLVGGARPSRHRRRADPGDAAGHRGAPALSQCALDHRQVAGMARGAGHQRERHRRHQRNPLRRQRPPRRARRHHDQRRSLDPAVRHRRAV